MDKKTKNPESGSKPLILAAIHDEELWNELKDPLEKNFRVRRETDGLRAIDVLFLLRPAAVIAESGLPGMSGILLARLIGHNRYLIKFPVVLILSREYLIEEFWAKDSGALDIVQRRDALELIRSLEIAVSPRTAITDDEWNDAEAGIKTQGGPAAGVAAELENQLISASILARLGEIDFAGESKFGDSHNPIPDFIWKALTALSSVLEFAQAGIALWESSEFFVVENEVFRDILDEEAFVNESKASAMLYYPTRMDPFEPDIRKLPSVHHMLPGPTGPARTFFALPLSGRNGNYGLLSIMTYKEIAVREYYLQTLSLIGSQLSVTLERALFYEEVRRLSITDPLTKLSNRRAIIQRLEEEFRRSIRYKNPLSMAICDLDNFKLINDRYGHQAGDLVLIEVSKILMDSVREVDLAGRWGGEEIALLFPQTKIHGAMVACERIRQTIEELRVPYLGNELSVTLSFGVSTVDPDEICPRSAETMMGLADHAMYLAKERGKNQAASFMETKDYASLLNIDHS